MELPFNRCTHFKGAAKNYHSSISLEEINIIKKSNTISYYNLPQIVSLYFNCRCPDPLKSINSLNQPRTDENMLTESTRCKIKRKRTQELTNILKACQTNSNHIRYRGFFTALFANLIGGFAARVELWHQWRSPSHRISLH